ncbi:chromobox protein 5-like [Histomonas meleagridis]|uniref:chromobox protein-like 5-like n=1 Tax=Histomonas meleagridis TaxID=135588 RepID=UPI0035599890|nr:chromobox protein 5-like [Histomonas meleagridis]KAH0804312.1 chromobox protein-like 5-like [Histomonas meleagridis]
MSEEDVYEVEAIVGERTRRGKKQFKVHWVGYPSEDDTWENEEDVDCDELIEEYREKVKKEIEENKSKSPEKKGRKRHTRKIIGVSKKDGKIKYSVQSSNGDVSTFSSKVLIKSMANKLVEFLEGLIPEDQSVDEQNEEKKEEKSEEKSEEKNDVLPLVESVDDIAEPENNDVNQ